MEKTREHLYRGKRLDNGEWVSSGNIIHAYDNGEHSYYIPVLNDKFGTVEDEYGNILSIEYGTFYKVDPDTVGENIGRADINGKKMFEGDIVKTASFVAVVGYSPAYAAFALEIWYKGEADDVLLFNDELVGDFEVIGNIHDNPELREVSHE